MSVLLYWSMKIFNEHGGTERVVGDIRVSKWEVSLLIEAVDALCLELPQDHPDYEIASAMLDQLIALDKIHKGF